MKTLDVWHSTVYRYSAPVELGPHRLMIRPRDSHDLRVVSSSLSLAPAGPVRWVHDVFGNSVTHVDFYEASDTLTIISQLGIERYAPEEETVFPVAAEAATYPFIYSNDDRTDLGRLLEQHYPDPKGVVAEWAHRFLPGKGVDTLALLAGMNAAIKANFPYARRDDEGTQSPIETLERGSGSCRDFALLLIEAVRCLGFGARFVSGYIFDPMLEQGGGATHAWADIYLPGAGWVEYDPTNGLIAGENLIRVAVTRDAAQAVPVAGSFLGDPSAFLGMEVAVTVTSGEQQPTAR